MKGWLILQMSLLSYCDCQAADQVEGWGLASTKYCSPAESHCPRADSTLLI